VADLQFANLVRKFLTDELLKIGIKDPSVLLKDVRKLEEKPPKAPEVAKPSVFAGGYGGGFGQGGYGPAGHPLRAKPGDVARPTEHWGFNIKKAMRSHRPAFRTSRTAYKPSFRRYI
jgi:hypothetical protein